jgi:hypothetical protein
MGLLQVIGGTEIDPSRDIKTFLGSVGFSPAPGPEISCDLGRSLILFRESTRTNLAPRPGRPANNSTTNDQQSESNADSRVESTWIPLGISSAERTEVDQVIVYADGRAESDRVPCSESPSERAQIQCTILYYYTKDILVAISKWRRQSGGTRRTSYGCILIMPGHTPPKCQGITSVSIE